MLQAVENGKKATWQYAIALSKIMSGEQYKEDFHDLKTFAEYVNSSKATLSQYNNAVAFMIRENLIPTKEQKNGKAAIDYAGINLTVANAYLLSVLSEEEVKRMRDEAKANEEADKADKERIDKINNADAMCFQTEKNLKDLGDKIPASHKSEIESALNSLKEAVKAQNLADIDTWNAKLEQAWHAASEEMAKSAQAGPQGPQAGPQGPQGPDNNDAPEEQ